ncbi:hypothetical protein F5884DRAFT_826691 [Xylogone sp. PMI_703]|nr:hypothetical protein F5884DRAFT_826691 [Xylogone sp. PMI_703]
MYDHTKDWYSYTVHITSAQFSWLLCMVQSFPAGESAFYYSNAYIRIAVHGFIRCVWNLSFGGLTTTYGDDLNNGSQNAQPARYIRSPSQPIRATLGGPSNVKSPSRRAKDLEWRREKSLGCNWCYLPTEPSKELADTVIAPLLMKCNIESQFPQIGIASSPTQWFHSYGPQRTTQRSGLLYIAPDPECPNVRSSSNDRLLQRPSASTPSKQLDILNPVLPKEMSAEHPGLYK